MKLVLRLLTLSLLVPATTVVAADWPHLRGPEFNGALSAPGTFEDAVGLDLAWKTTIGSGYSGVAVGSGRAVTMFAEGDGNWVAAYDTRTGKQIWKHRLGGIFKGADGSDDGPLSSPAIGKGLVYVLDPRGRLAALSLKNGEAIWTKQIDEEFGAKAPHFGFTTSPLPEGGVLVVQTGGAEGPAIVGLDAKSGKTLWTHGNDEVIYQSPAAMTLAGERTIVAISKTRITGLSPESGKVLWVHALAEDDRVNSASPSFIGDDRFVTLITGTAVAFKVTRGQDGFSVEELYRSEALGRNYAPPVYHDGHLYGFRGQVLTCVNADNGERVWRSRPPGGDGLIVVDGHLVIFGSKGSVVVARATSDGYQEKARLQALEGSALTWPSFGDGKIFVRNLGELAAVSITGDAGAAPDVSTMPGDHDFGRWVHSVEASNNRPSMVEVFFAKHPTMPVLEGEYVHFVFRGDSEDVSIAGSMVDIEAPEKMHRIEGTDVFYRTYRLEPGARWEYRFNVDFEEWMPDPLNPRSVPAIEGEDPLSEVITEGYEVGKHVEDPAARRGKMDEFTLASETLGYEKNIKVWTPPGYADGDAAYPVLIVNDGESWLNKGLMGNSLENLVGHHVEPVIVAFVDSYSRWWTEAGGSATAEYAEMLVNELLPELKKRYRVRDEPRSHGVMGNRFYALSAAYTAVKYPEVFGKASIQSVYLGLGAGQELTAMLEGKKGSSIRFYVDWNRYDERNIDRGYDFAEDSRTLAGLLKSNGYTLEGGEVLDSQGWSGWRNRTDEMLTALFPAN